MAAHGPFLLPDDVLADILARLPRRSIGCFRAVCRAWNAIASSPSADRLFAKRPAAVTAITEKNRSLEVDDERRPVYIVRFDFFRGRWHPDVHSHKRGPCPRAVSLDDVTIAAEAFRSWDGVLCTRVFPREPQPGAGAGAGADYMLWNPLTNACAVVSAPAGEGRIIGGYAHPATGRFHLLHCSDVAVPRHRDLVAPITARILAVGDGTAWREVPLPSSLSMMGERDHSVSLHGNLHWLVQPAGSGKVALLVFDTAQEKFWVMAAPERPGLDPATARSRVVPGGKLCVLALTQQPPVALEVWMLDDYSDTRSWRFRETVRLDSIRLPPRSDWPRWFAAAAAVEVVEGVHEGEEIFIQHEHGIIAYSVRNKVWRNVSVGQSCAALLVHRESVMRPEISFGKALRVFRRRTVTVSRRSSRYGMLRRRSYISFDTSLEGSVSES